MWKRTRWYSSCRLCGKCSQMWFETAMPAFFSSYFRRSVTSGTHDPQVVPALVQLLTAPTTVSFCSRMALQICPLLTLLHEQICAPSGSAVTPAPARFSPLPAGRISSSGAGGRTIWFWASCKSSPYDEASPTSIPPRRCLRSAERTSFL